MTILKYWRRDINDTGQDLNDIDWDALPDIKPGTKLPKAVISGNWPATMPVSPIDKSNIKLVAERMNSIIYDYFRDNYGLLDDSRSVVFGKYMDMYKSALKLTLKNLKASHA